MKTIILLLLSTNFVMASDFDKKAHDYTVKLEKNLGKELKGSMKKSGPEGALKHCHLKAQTITQALRADLVIGRSSEKMRNPINAPKAWMNKAFEHFNKTNSKKPLSYKVEGKNAYFRPIYVKGICLKCHGDKFSKNLSDKISKLYPKDKATGYKAGDFRGLFWVKER